MGTSNSYGGTSSDKPLIPTWLDDGPLEPNDAPDAPPFPTGSPNPNPPPPVIPAPNPPIFRPIPAAPPQDRFAAARNNLSRFAGSGGRDRSSLGRALSHYVSTSAGGSRTAAQRMGTSRATGGRLLGFLSNVVGTGPGEALRTLNLERLAGRPVEEVFLGLMDYVCPFDGGTVDEGIAREAFIETIADLAENGIVSLDNLSVDQMQTIFELYAAHAIEARLCNDIGAKIIVLPASAPEAASVQRQLFDFIRRSVSDALTQARTAIQTLTPERVMSFVSKIYEQCFNILQSIAELEAEGA